MPTLPTISFNPHDNPKGPGDGRPTAEQIMLHEDGADRIKGKTVLVTGGSSGIGTETARVLAAAGAIVYLPVRDKTKGQTAIERIRSEYPNAVVHLLSLDLDDLDSVRACAADFLRQSSQLHILINNAGVMACPYGRTKQGFETQFGTNHLAHFLLFELLKPTLLASSTAAFHSRVVNLSSVGHNLHPPQLDDLNFDKSGYNKWFAYGQSKTANIWMALEIERRYGHAGLHGLAVHPGGIQTNLGRHLNEGFTADDFATFNIDPKDVEGFLQKTYKTPSQGTATTIYAAVSNAFEGKGGLYLAECAVAPPAREDLNKLAGGYSKWAYDRDGAKRLYDISLQLVGLSAPNNA